MVRGEEYSVDDLDSEVVFSSADDEVEEVMTNGVEYVDEGSSVLGFVEDFVVASAKVVDCLKDGLDPDAGYVGSLDDVGLNVEDVISLVDDKIDEFFVLSEVVLSLVVNVNEEGLNPEVG